MKKLFFITFLLLQKYQIELSNKTSVHISLESKFNFDFKFNHFS